MYTPFALPFDPNTLIPVAFILEQNRYFSDRRPFIFYYPDTAVLSHRVCGVITRKSLTLLCDGSYAISLSKERKQGEIPICVTGDHAPYCCFYLHVGDTILCSNCSKMYFLEYL